MPTRRGSRRRRNDLTWIAGLFALGVLVFMAALVIAAVGAFWQAVGAGDPGAIATLVVVLVVIGGAVGFAVYRWLMRRGRRLAAQRAYERQTVEAQQMAEQRAYEAARAEQEYTNWLRSADMAALDRMTGIQFEHALSELFTDLGFGAAVTQASHDYGADLVLTRGGQSVVVQAKRYVGALGLDAVQEATAARLHYGAVRAIVVTTSDFTAPARKLAQTTGVELWDRQRLNEELASVAARRGVRPALGVAVGGVVAGNGDRPMDRMLDPLFARAARAVAAEGAASVSRVQQKFSLGYSRAGRIIDQLADHGVIGGYQGTKQREVLMNLPDVDELLERMGLE